MSALEFARDLTNLGDLAVLLPVAFTMLVWLGFSSSWRLAATWALAFAICISGTGLLKVLFLVCQPGASLHSPSGHSSLSALVYGGIAMVVVSRGETWQRVLGVGIGFALVAAIAATRVILMSHTIVETAIGLAIGAIALTIFGAQYFPQARSGAPIRPLLLAIALVVVVLHGQQLHAESLVRAIGDYLRTDGLACG